MAQDHNIGLGAALEGLGPHGAGTPSGLPAQEQGELLDLDGPEGAEGPVTQTLRDRAGGPGRPKGSPNKRTEDLRRYILHRFKHPIVAAAEIYSMPVSALAAALDCDKDAAAALQLKAIAVVAPYVDSTMPQRMQIDADPRLPEFRLLFSGPDGSAVAVDAKGNRLDIVALADRAKTALNQRLIEGEATRSHDDQSHGDGINQPDQALETF